MQDTHREWVLAELRDLPKYGKIEDCDSNDGFSCQLKKMFLVIEFIIFVTTHLIVLTIFFRNYGNRYLLFVSSILYKAF